ncbi:LysE family translocator [Deferribacterales bacterium Es71-Z0220]|uniref:LysE family translocator n=1 Tax=Deferrivibrio essentukiensis TaxID=2880922 RepID=UPI001F61D12A|nr:LysE family translocator [Deferrivibrio essentukiensis]MCB4203486.1 LysE family translocator [Deferrivibrio essentukiensis]
MSLLTAFGLALAIFILAVVPGPGVYAVVSKSIAHGFKNTIPTVLGIVAGDILFLTFALFGLTIIAETLWFLFLVIKYAGAAYLCFLGVKLFFSKNSNITVSKNCNKTGFFSGLFITLGNPKVILFYVGFLPTFLDFSLLTWVDIALTITIVCAVLSAVMLFYAFLSFKVRKFIRGDAATTAFNKLAGMTMFSAGVLILSRK